ncbi:MAG: hypothetical protein IIC85_08075 [Chloroflexi bacterium]|nr:hypothetical protein [Chloroflexota bacterium]
MVDVLIYGMESIPGAKPPFSEEHQLNAMSKALDLLRVSDVDKISFDTLTYEFKGNEPLDNPAILRVGVFEMERAEKAPPLVPPTSKQIINQTLRTNAYHSEVNRVVNNLRAFVYCYVSSGLAAAENEKENVELLGPDYGLILDSVGALNSPVKEELMSALRHVKSDSSTDWALAALGCRNVVLQLGKSLLITNSEVYKSSLLEKDITLKGNAEKNRLSAYINEQYEIATDDKTKDKLGEAFGLVESIYDDGSRGKGRVRRQQAQELVINTFRMVDLLADVTGLAPLSYPPED